MFKRIGVVLVVSCAALLSACSTTAPTYSASLDNVDKLKADGDYKVTVGKFAPATGLKTESEIALRTTSMSSPYGNSYSQYLAEAIKQELSLAGKLAPASPVQITGTLLENDVDTGVATGKGVIKARIVVTSGNTTRYDQVKSAETEWSSNFVAAIAIPRATEAYPKLVQKLLTSLLNDDAFLKALQ
ncbi:hypothetical protein [Pandoraea sp. PE-S2R-1]|uniref:hypothetical protein n=1 Tax=Pandoraea sp. PE-S2R-1 TaxID=1986994 RepID=UPI000B404BCA|nr:hypothetical protein [Pandoraea sp. PE-S2R-1]